MLRAGLVVARTWKLGTIIGQYSPLTHGCPYSSMVTRSSCAAMLSITAVARRSGRADGQPGPFGLVVARPQVRLPAP